VGLFLAVVTVVLIGGVLWGAVIGLYFAIAAFTFGELLRTAWLGWRSREARARASAGNHLPA